MIRIAVVEDLEDEARQLTKCIEQYGREKNEVFAVERFSDGLAFMEGYEPRYDIIFMDINMPLMSGLSAAKRLRVEEALPPRPADLQLAVAHPEGIAVDFIYIMQIDQKTVVAADKAASSQGPQLFLHAF